MKRSPLIILFILCFAVSSGIAQTKKDNYTGKKPKNIILLVGDGMGLSEVSAAIYYKKGVPNFERFSTIGLSKTSASSHLVTDSAAGATAFSTGKKSYNGAIGVDKDTLAIETIVEKLSRKGISTGLVATSSIVHATPASFFAHVKSRRLYDEIASFMPNSEVDFFAGGGLKYFNQREDGRDLIAELKAKDFEIHTDKLPTTLNGKKQAILLAEDGMPKMVDNRGDFLPKATALALKHLSKNKKGFFLMAEGSQIDWGGHSNDADYLISELLDFDETLAVALDFAKKNGETLVIVTADHETGGFTLATKGGDYNKLDPVFSTGGHSGTMVPVFAEGPGASLFGGIYENTAIYDKMMLLLNK
ncbi:alkaline phosphatase [Cochleicola gelatinilyticus]|uniref:Alkaline phosphatase n=1 Tax=Cochleicola gelatinilyticus TaxID=1763537 RepID=A0A167IH04_9FLAO|nr:alkaline phosphatase [Cochleicola gelatinilyticus]OAB79642.1 alkaline phosphatase [Cochleicola gelatinilyticus]